MRSLPLCLLLAFLSAVPCACNRGDNGAAVNDPADDADFLEPANIPGGVADDKGKVGYLANPKGGIDAVDLESGKLLWHTNAASYPLLVYKDRLLAQESHDADPIRIVALDVANKGKRVMASDPIQLAPTPKELKAIQKKEPPATPLAEPPDGKVTTFCRGRIKQGQLHLIWGRHFTARIDLATGKVTKLPRTPSAKRSPSTEDYSEIAKIAADPKAFGAPQKLPEMAKLEDPQPRELFNPQKEQPMHFRTRWVAGDVLALLLEQRQRSRSRTLLVLWDVKTGKNLHSSEILQRSREEDGVIYPAFHGRYVVRYSTGRRDLQPTRPVAVFALESRKWSPTIWLESQASDIWPAGPRLFYAIRNDTPSEGTLKAVDLALQRDGPPPQAPSAPPDARQRILWERPVLLPVYGLPSWEEGREP